MAKVTGSGSGLTHSLTRRSVLEAGVLGLGGLTLADVLRGRAAANESDHAATAAKAAGATTAVIFVELAGGPSHFETYDPKPLAPKEYRGPLEAIQTNVPGCQFSELMTAQAAIADQLTVFRSIQHSNNSHEPSSHLTQTGYYKAGAKGAGNVMPSFGAVAARFHGPNHDEMPAYVAIPRAMRNGGAAQLGRACEPFETMDDPNNKKFEVRNLSLVKGMTADRLDDRNALLTSLDSQRKIADLHGSSEAIDEFTRKALELVTGSRARDAFDIAKESDRVREAYGRNTVGQSMLLARRLVEAGVTCVTVRVTGWDDHTNIAKSMRAKGPNYDRAMAALIGELRERGLDRRVLVVAMGEFGRTPRVNKTAGRDHWGAVMSVVLAGGGLKTGIFGASNGKGEVPTSSAYRPENILAMVYRHLGIDPARTFNDLAGRPRHLLEERTLIREIV